MLLQDGGLGAWLENESMARHVSWKAGGRTRLFFRPNNVEALVQWFEHNSEEAIYPIGLGSNLLVRDGGFDGTIFCTHHALSTIRWETCSESRNGQGLIYAEAGVPSPKVARMAIQHGLNEAEWLATVPGTVGGALAMNAGCYGHDTWTYVRRVAVLVPGEGYREFGAEHYVVGYRSVKLQDRYVGHEQPHYFLGAWFDFPRNEAGDVESNTSIGIERMKALLTRRVETQPLNLPNAGSVFRNPEGDFAARLIEACGLKGYARGGACVSEKHANFIVNPQGKATATDIEQLMIEIRRKVIECTGVMLVPEVRIIGVPA